MLAAGFQGFQHPADHVMGRQVGPRWDVACGKKRPSPNLFNSNTTHPARRASRRRSDGCGKIKNHAGIAKW